MLTREIRSVPVLLDSLTVALNKVYQRKGVDDNARYLARSDLYGGE